MVVSRHAREDPATTSVYARSTIPASMARAYRSRWPSCSRLPRPRAGRQRSAVAFVDLLESLPAAERRAAPPIDNAIHVDLTGPSGDLRPSIVTSAPARVIWSTRFPSRARLDTAVMLVDRAPGVPSAGAAAGWHLGRSVLRTTDQNPARQRRRRHAGKRFNRPPQFRLAMEPVLSSIGRRPGELIFNADAACRRDDRVGETNG